MVLCRFRGVAWRRVEQCRISTRTESYNVQSASGTLPNNEGVGPNGEHRRMTHTAPAAQGAQGAQTHG